MGHLFSHVREDNGEFALHNTDYIINLEDISVITRQFEKVDGKEETSNIRVTMKSGAEFCLPTEAGDQLIKDLQDLVNCTQATRALSEGKL